jgi:hypothetical protein
MYHWEFTPYNLEEWNKAEERVLFVGSEPNGDNPHGEILDMGQWFRTACAENNYLGNLVQNRRYLQHLCTFRGRKKVVISSFPDFKGKVQVTAMYSNIWQP